MNRSIIAGAQVLAVLMIHLSVDSRADEFIDQSRESGILGGNKASFGQSHDRSPESRLTQLNDPIAGRSSDKGRLIAIRAELQSG